MVKIVDYYYEQSSSIIAQGNYRKIQRYRDQGFYEVAGGFGTYRMVRPSVAKVYFTIDENKEVLNQSVKQLIRDCFNVERVTKKRLETFVSACKLGIIDLKYSSDSGLYI